MYDRTTRPAGYWQQLERNVGARVGAAMSIDAAARQPILTYLRGLEGRLRKERDRRETIQVIASGRRLLGDRSNVGPIDGPFSRFMPDAP